MNDLKASLKDIVMCVSHIVNDSRATIEHVANTNDTMYHWAVMHDPVQEVRNMVSNFRIGSVVPTIIEQVWKSSMGTWH